MRMEEGMKVLIVCSGGMSSTIAEEALAKECSARGVDTEVSACGTSALEESLKDGFDAVLVAPQVRHRFKDLEAVADAAGVPIALIQPMAYSPLGGAKLYRQLAELVPGLPE